MCRAKREEDRIAREMAEKEEEEARAVLEQAAKSGKIKLPTTGDKLDKEAILNQVAPASLPLQTPPSRVDQEGQRIALPCWLRFPICCHNLWQRVGYLHLPATWRYKDHSSHTFIILSSAIAKRRCVHADL